MKNNVYAKAAIGIVVCECGLVNEQWILLALGGAAVEQLREEKEFAEGQVQLSSAVFLLLCLNVRKSNVPCFPPG